MTLNPCNLSFITSKNKAKEMCGDNNPKEEKMQDTEAKLENL